MYPLYENHTPRVVFFSLLFFLGACGDLPDRERNHRFRPQGSCDARPPVVDHLNADGLESSDADCPDGGDSQGQVATVVVLPDTQFYASSYPTIFEAQTRWIREQTPTRNIQAVLHVGDIVDTIFEPSQWMVATKALRVLDGVVPYVLVPGNHDQDGARKGLLNTYFAPSTMPWITGTMVEGQMENNYSVLAIGPQKWLVIGLEFGPRNEVLLWADGVLKAHPELPAIIVTHAYLYSDGTRYDWAAKGEGQHYNPHWYGPTATEGINDGEEMWHKLVVPNPNVRLVFSGHMNTSPYALARRTDTRPTGGLPVHQLLQDFQSNTNGGDGYLRILEFDYTQEVIRVRTYSPTLKASISDKVGQFTLTLDV